MQLFVSEENDHDTEHRHRIGSNISSQRIAQLSFVIGGLVDLPRHCATQITLGLPMGKGGHIGYRVRPIPYAITIARSVAHKYGYNHLNNPQRHRSDN